MARTLLRAALSEAGADPFGVCDAELVLTEMIANAVLHGKAAPDGTIEVAWRLVDGSVELRVTDSGDTAGLTASMPGPEASGGRGLALIDRIADRWSYNGDAGTQVTAAVRVMHRTLESEPGIGRLGPHTHPSR